MSALASVESVKEYPHCKSQNILDQPVSILENNALILVACLLQGCPNPNSANINKETLSGTTFQSGGQELPKLTNVMKTQRCRVAYHECGSRTTTSGVWSGLRLPSFSPQDLSCFWPSIKVTAGHAVHSSHFLMLFHTSSAFWKGFFFFLQHYDVHPKFLVKVIIAWFSFKEDQTVACRLRWKPDAL